MFKRYIILLAMSVLFANAADHGGHSQVDLSAPVKKLIIKEMRLIQKGMLAINKAAVRGDWKEIEKTAMQIKNSYILKQKLTAAQKKELGHKLPADFKEKDQKLHEYAGMLAHVAEEKKLELVSFYTYKMTESCMACHAKYAPQRFTGFKSLKPKEHKH
jgi:cytochrome c556